MTITFNSSFLGGSYEAHFPFEFRLFKKKIFLAFAGVPSRRERKEKFYYIGIVRLKYSEYAYNTMHTSPQIMGIHLKNVSALL